MTEEARELRQIAFQPLGKRVTAPAGTTLLEAGRAAGLVLSANCGGIGVCRRCRVSVLSGEMEPPVPAERASLSPAELEAGERLACRARIRSDVAIHVPASFLTGRQRLQLDGEEALLVCEPLVERAPPALGLAVDLGCTKIAGYLVDLCSGRQLAAEGVPNPQISFGEDLISRLVFAAASAEQAQRLAGSVRTAIDGLAASLCSRAGVEPRDIADACIVGNTAMMHLLLALPVGQLLHAPFVSALDGALDCDAEALGLRLAAGARVHVPPAIGGFVGADHVAMILAHALDRADATVVGIDIGTNTEIVLAKPAAGLMLATSVPSGPAFEGGHIRDGMRAAAGAIEKVSLGGSGELRYETIEDAAPVGLCGSGVVDLIAQLRASGRVNERGALLEGDERVRAGPDGREFVLVGAGDSGHGREIVLTQADITEVQLAKAAVQAGIRSLLELTHTALEEVEELIVAGAFGSHLDLESAVTIGLLPRLPNARYRQVGNAAGVGAKMMLVSGSARARSGEIARRAQRIELKSHAGFNGLLARATRFPPLEAASREAGVCNEA